MAGSRRRARPLAVAGGIFTVFLFLHFTLWSGPGTLTFPHGLPPYTEGPPNEYTLANPAPKPLGPDPQFQFDEIKHAMAPPPEDIPEGLYSPHHPKVDEDDIDGRRTGSTNAHSQQHQQEHLDSDAAPINKEPVKDTQPVKQQQQTQQQQQQPSPPQQQQQQSSSSSSDDGAFDSQRDRSSLLKAESEIVYDIPRNIHFPLPEDEIIGLPTVPPRSFPKIQAEFLDLSTEEEAVRRERQQAVKRAFTHAWEGYKKYAWGHDELRPNSRGFRDNFCGWGATLVDSLDALQILGLNSEYEAAKKVVTEIDFSRTKKMSVPMFETVIRYLGGLIGAYDVSQQQDRILLVKAEQLADMLLGAFDTPNRMPLLFFDWRPQATRQVRKAPMRSSLAELGTLTLEFTRLAQLTGNNTYFDAVQRITNALEEFEDSDVPGLWPMFMDASGCKNVKSSMEINDKLVTPPDPANVVFDPSSGRITTDDQSQPRAQLKNFGVSEEDDAEIDPRLGERDTADDSLGGSAPQQPIRGGANGAGARIPNPNTAPPKTTKFECEPMSLVSAPGSTRVYTLGGAADSAYEYLIKQHLLMGGTTEQYERLYRNALAPAKKHLIFRPLIEGNLDIRLAGNYIISDSGKTKYDNKMEHLTCFAGGMVGLASRSLNIPEDMDLAEKLTEGCVWAYDVTATGIMPEKFVVQRCESEPCNWKAPSRKPIVSSEDKAIQKRDPLVPPPGGAAHPPAAAPKQESAKESPPLPKPAPEVVRVASGSGSARGKEQQQQANINTDNWPLSFLDVEGKYFLRPEAIESVFIMWRLTGDPKWREKGWRMFEAIDQVTWTESGYSAIKDVTDPNTVQLDSMER